MPAARPPIPVEADPRAAAPLVHLVTPELDDYLSSFSGLRLSGFLLARAEGPWSVTRRRLSSCVVEHALDAAPWAARGATVPGVLTFAFAAGPRAELRVDGFPAETGELLCWPGGTRVAVVARQPAELFVVTVSEAGWPALAAPRGGGGDGPTASRSCGSFEPERLLGLVSRAIRATAAPDAAGAQAEEETALERALLDELAERSGAPAAGRRHGGSARIDRYPVLERIEALLDERPSESLYIADLCAATGLPERTLRYILVEEYGLSPVRVLRNRRLCQLRRSLRAEDGRRENLAGTAERHGFRHMGSLASDYRSLFGELPSETRRSAGGPPLATSGPTADASRRDDLGERPEATSAAAGA